jgi:hypothetical protein
LASSDPKKRIPITALRIMGERAYGLTAKQETFCLNYAAGNITQTEAARRAGFANPAFAATRFLNGRDYPQILARIAEIKEELSRKYEVSFDGHVRQLAKIRDMALGKGNYTAAVAAEKSRGQVAGLYISRSEILVGKIDQMSREEVLAEIEKLHQEYPALAANPAPKQDLSLIEDVTFEEVLEPILDEVRHEPDSEEPEHRGRSLEEPPSRDDEDGPLDEDRSPRRRWHPRP